MREVLRRTDWLNEMHGVLAIAVALTGIAGAVRTVAILAGQPLDVNVSSEGVLRSEALTDMPSGVAIDSELRLQVDQPTGIQRGWELLAPLPSFLPMTLALVLLWRLVGQARRGDPFTGDMVSRFRTLGLLLVVGGPAVWLLESIGRFALSATVSSGVPYGSIDFAVPTAWLLGGFGMFAIGEILRRGQALRTELDGVV
jgi:hypothetical protein